MDRELIEKTTNKMVHDVRTPLTILNMLYSTFSARLKDQKDAQDELKILKEETDKIDKIVSSYREQLKQML